MGTACFSSSTADARSVRLCWPGAHFCTGRGYAEKKCVENPRRCSCPHAAGGAPDARASSATTSGEGPIGGWAAYIPVAGLADDGFVWKFASDVPDAQASSATTPGEGPIGGWDFPGGFIKSETEECGVSQAGLGRPFYESDLRHELRLRPVHLAHLIRRDAPAPSPDIGVRKIGGPRGAAPSSCGN
jgi:hypothetical protein